MVKITKDNDTVSHDDSGNYFLGFPDYTQVILKDGRYGIGSTKEKAVHNALVQTKKVRKEN